MKLIMATDHNGVEYKRQLMQLLANEFEIVDASTDNYEYDDYPDFAFRVGEMLQGQPDSMGVLVCGTGIGMSIAANKVKGVRCALVTSARAAKLARRDDDANVIALDSTMNPEFAAECIRLFTRTPFCREVDRYSRRKKKIEAYENGEYK